ncbi:hypothetical protein ACVJGD_005554 [Bradyrhizobium sp. USDA 10063]
MLAFRRCFRAHRPMFIGALDPTASLYGRSSLVLGARGSAGVTFRPGGLVPLASL